MKKLDSFPGDIQHRRFGDLYPAGEMGKLVLYKALSVNGNASFATVLKVLDALGVRLQPQAIQSLEGVHETSASDDKHPARS